MGTAIYAVDVGSTIERKGISAFAWCRVVDSESSPSISLGTCIEKLSKEIASDLNNGQRVALGLEAPLFIPVPDDRSRLSRARDREGNRSWAAPAGGYVATLALHQTAWMLRKIRENCKANAITISVDPIDWVDRKSPQPMLFGWEAFVSGAAHGNTHLEDATTAAMWFRDRQDNLISAVTAEKPISLFGAAVLWSGWSSDVSWLNKQLVVLCPDEVWAPTAAK